MEGAAGLSGGLPAAPKHKGVRKERVHCERRL